MQLRGSDVARFGILVGFSAIFIDASIAHGLFWENDPYWTYWITKTFLITTVFTIGTAFLGVGIGRGLVITAVHTLILEIYYQWFAPVGLPQEPEWLDFNHLWTTGVPAHFLAIFSGYLFALWVWQRSRIARAGNRRDVADEADARGSVVFALVSALIVLVLDGVITSGLLIQRFPGLTFFIQHLLIGFVFLFFWRVFVGFDGGGWIVGSIMLSLIWTTYSMYLGPQGLPTKQPTYLGYNDLWLKSFPGGFIAAAIGLWLASRFVGRRVAAAATVVLLFVLPSKAEAKDGLPASASATGNAKMIVGSNPVDMNSSQPATGSITINTIDNGNRWSHVQNTDHVDVIAEFTSGGSRYQVRIMQAMPRHPLGKYTTWSGVIYRHYMHGNTGIGTAKLPKMKPEIALYGWADVTKDGTVISRMAPTHVMVTTEGPMQGVILEVDTEDKALIGERDGYITVAWPNVSTISMPHSQVQTRQIVGWIVLIGITLGLWMLVRSQRPIDA